MGCTHCACGKAGWVGDYKITINRASKLDIYPIPKVNDLFSQLASGRNFLAHHQQVILDEKSRQYVVVNTHKGHSQQTFFRLQRYFSELWKPFFRNPICFRVLWRHPHHREDWWRASQELVCVHVSKSIEYLGHMSSLQMAFNLHLIRWKPSKKLQLQSMCHTYDNFLGVVNWEVFQLHVPFHTVGTTV